VGQDGAAYKSDLGETRSEKYLHMGLDNQSTEQPVGQITANLSRRSLGKTRSAVRNADNAHKSALLFC
jgi:hypothetical protein